MFYFWIEIVFLVKNILSGVSCVIAIAQKNEGTHSKSEKSLSQDAVELFTGDSLCISLGFFGFFSFTFLDLYLLFGKNVSE